MPPPAFKPADFAIVFENETFWVRGELYRGNQLAIVRTRDENQRLQFSVYHFHSRMILQSFSAMWSAKQFIIANAAELERQNDSLRGAHEVHANGRKDCPHRKQVGPVRTRQ